MIAVSCGGCRHEFETPDMKAGMDVLCPMCMIRVKVPRPGEEQRAPELVGAHVAEGARSIGGDTRAPAPGTHGMSDRFSREPAPNPAGEWDEPDDDSKFDGTRNFEPHIEDELRRGHLFRIGMAMTIAFFLPIAGAPGRFLFFPQFSTFPGMSLAGLAVLLPLIAGITMMLLAKRSDTPLRGAVTLGLGVMLFGLMLVDRGASSAISQSVNALPSSVSLSLILLTLGSFGLLISARLRWYRPTSHHAFMIGAVAAGSYGLYLFIPSNGSMPIAGVFDSFKMHKMLGLGVLVNVGLMVAAGVICAMNHPSTLSSDASAKARRAFLCLVGAVVIPAFLIGIAAISMFSSMSMGGMGSGSPSTMLISSAVKFGVMYGGLVLLIPIGIVDLLVGRP